MMPSNLALFSAVAEFKLNNFTFQRIAESLISKHIFIQILNQGIRHRICVDFYSFYH